MGKPSKRLKKTAAEKSAPEATAIPAKGTLPSWTGSVTFHLALIAVLGILIYSNTFNAPFQWDEGEFITENAIVKDLAFFLEPSKANGLEFYTALEGRYIGFLTFALDYKLHGLDATGYHIVNLAIHILNALLFYSLVILTFRTPFMRKSSLAAHFRYIALLASLLFVSHPIQTEAVTYVFQRLASLMAFFYLLSLTAYIKARLSNRNVSKYAFYVLSLVSALLAMKTKENAFTLPFVIAIYEFLFFAGPKRFRILYLIPLLLTLLIVPLALIDMDKPVGEIIGGISPATRGNQEISRADYLFTQFRVVVTYIRLLFLPVNQNLVYDYPVFHSFFNPQVFLSFLFLSSIFSLGIYLLYRSKSRPDLRVSAFGVFWFFITLSVESSIIPIQMVICEYRVYLPSVGFFAALSTVISLIFHRWRRSRIPVFVGMFLIIAILSYATYARNTVWGSRISLWEDVVRKSPWKAEAHNNLGNAYTSKGLTDKAVEHYRTALILQPDDAVAYNNLGSAYAAKGMTDKAIEYFQTAIRLTPDYALAYYNLGLIYKNYGNGSHEKAIEHYQAAVRLKPDYAEAYYNLGLAYQANGLFDKAVEQYQIAIRLKPDFAPAYADLGVAHYSKGSTDKAIEYYLTALKLKPDIATAHYNLGTAYGSKGMTDKAIEHFRIALSLKPDYAKAHYNLGAVYLSEGIIDKARMEFEEALKLNPADHEAKRHLDRINGMPAKVF